MTTSLLHGDCREVLRTLPDCSVDSVVTDPPYELGFMGKQWDASGVAYDIDLWREVLRVLKSGGHLLAFGGTRTYHRMAVAIEDAGFEIRDSIHWLYGSGFPKSLDVSKAIDKAAGAEREVTGHKRGVGVAAQDNQFGGINRGAVGVKQVGVDVPVTAPATDAAKQWEGWGTALKPAHEPIVVARKQLAGTVAANVLEHGTGAINIDGCRIHRYSSDVSHAGQRTATFGTQETVSGGDGSGGWQQNDAGRWPANVIVDDYITHTEDDWPRYFYCAKPSKKERNAGLDGLEKRKVGTLNMRTDGHSEANGQTTTPAQNHHPTVKPLALMRWLVRLVTPPGGTVLEPFAGSGTTLMACILEGFNSIGIEMTDEYLPIIEGRIAWAEQQTSIPTDEQLAMF